MRIGTDGDRAYRNDAIEPAAKFYDCNKTKAVVSACDDVPQLVAAIEQVLHRDDLTLEHRGRSPIPSRPESRPSASRPRSP